MKMKPNYAQILLEDDEFKRELKLCIKAKETRLKALHASARASLDAGMLSVKNEFDRWFLLRLWDLFGVAEEMRAIHRDLNRMNFELKRSTKASATTKWDDKYNHAKNLDIANVVSKYTCIEESVLLRRNIKCPIHEDKTPSLKVYKNTNTFKCFGCNAGGSPIDFIMAKESCSFKEAVEIAAAI